MAAELETRLQISLKNRDIPGAYNLLLGQERYKLGRRKKMSYGSGFLPKVTWRQQTWVEVARSLTQTKGKVNILEIGAGDDCAAWTGGLMAKVSQGRDALLEHDLQAQVTAHSGEGSLSDWVVESGVDEFLSGHYLDVLESLKDGSRIFDLVLSRFGLYHSYAALEVLPLIDDILSQDGVAILDHVGRGVEHRDGLIYRPDDLPNDYISQQDLYTSLNYPEAHIGAIPWFTIDGGYSVAWRKGEFSRERMPKLVDILYLGFMERSFPPRLVYIMD
ncbi:hypothetical protein HY612_02435 [Candidatus Roizmanbacteria bacterium]|nr:hypothetical protein [Candidatus Roizmanbacteria bacterium]